MVSAQDYLITIAQIAIAIAGFSSIVEALSTRHMNHWTDEERYKFRLLLQVSAVAMFFALLPMILVQVLEESIAWRVSLLIYGVVHLMDIGSFIIKLPAGVPSFVKATIAVGLTIVFSQLFIAITNQSSLMIFIYLVALAWQIFIAFLGFAMLLYGVRPKTAENREKDSLDAKP
jgi:MFS family permease